MPTRPRIHSARTPIAGTTHIVAGTLATKQLPRGSSSPLVQYARVNSAAYATVIPLLYGTTRVSPTILWFGDWAIISPLQSSGTSGSTGVPSAPTGKTYSVSMLLAFCSGPGASFGKMWQANSIQAFPASYVAQNFTALLGAYTDLPWSYLTTKHPEEALTYRGLMKVGAANYNVGSTPQIPQFNFEVSGFQLFGRGVLDAEPSDILFDMLTDPFHGSAFPAANLDLAGTWELYAEANVAVGLLLSPLMDSQQSAAQWLQLILNITVSAAVWSDGLLKILPFYDQPVSGNGASYVPQLTPVIPSSGPDDYLVMGTTAVEPVTMVRALPADRFSEIRIEFTNRANNYNVETAYAKSQSDIDVYALRTAQAVQYHPITTGLTAMKVARMQLVRNLTVRNQFHFSLSQKYIWLDPLDIWPLTAPELGLFNYPVRIISIELDLQENLNVIAEDLGICNASGIVGGERHGSAQPPTINPFAVPSINAPIIFEETAAMTYGRIYVCFALSGQNANVNWGGTDILWSEDNVTFEQLGRVIQPAKQGVLLSDLPSYGGRSPDNVNTLAVDLSESAGGLQTIALQNAQAKHNLLIVCNNDGSNIEFMSFQAATVIGAFQFNLTMLFRGLYGTTPTLHSAANSQIAFLGYVSALDQGIFRWEYPLRLVGQTIFFKFPSLDLSRLVEQNPNDPTQVTSYAYSLIGGNSRQVTVSNFVLVNFQDKVVAQVVTGLIAQGQQIIVSALGTLTAVGSGRTGAVALSIVDASTTVSTTITTQVIQIPASGDYAIQLALQYSPTRTATHTYQLKAEPNGLTSAIIDTVTLEIGIISPNVVQEG